MTTGAAPGAVASVRLLAQSALLCVTAIWGLTFVMVQDAVARTPVLSFLAERFLLAALVAAVLARRQLRGLSRDGWRAGVGMGLFLTAGYVLQTYGLTRTTAAHSGFITGLFVVFTPLLAAVVGRRRPSPITVVCMVLSLSGLALLAGVGGKLHPLGDGLTVGCALAFAAHILVTDRATRGHAVSALLVVQLGVCGLACGVGAAAQGRLDVPPTGSVWLALLVTALFASALAFFVQTAAQRLVSPERTALILAGEPAFAGLFAYLLKGERLSSAGWAGAALILAAILLVELLPRRSRPPRPTPQGPPVPSALDEAPATARRVGGPVRG
jgi:drug/metabolite transporter (DMT)-like permease